MLDEKRGLVAKCTKNGYTHYLYRKTHDLYNKDNYYMSTVWAPSGFYAEDDKDAIECFAKYCGVSVENIVA